MTIPIEVILAPRELELFEEQDLSRATCVVFDILRATSSMVAALAAGANEIIPVNEIEEALSLHHQNPELLLAGERKGLRILKEQTGSIDFHFGNSPREFTSERVRGHSIVMTTTNGTRALKSCQRAATTLIGSFLNMAATLDWVAKTKPAGIFLICAGTFESPAYEDIAAAGCFINGFSMRSATNLSDSARIAAEVFEQNSQLREIAQKALNGRRLLASSELAGDVDFCLRSDIFPVIGKLSPAGAIRMVY